MSIPEQIIYYFLRVDRFWHCIVVHSLLSFWGRAFPLAIGSAAHARTVSPRLIVGLRAWKSQRRAQQHSTHHSSYPYDLFRIPEQMTVEGSASCQGKER